MTERQLITVAVVLWSVQRHRAEQRGFHGPMLIQTAGSMESLIRAIEEAEDDERHAAWEEKQRTE